MFETVYQTNFKDKVITSKKPVLLTYLLADNNYTEHIVILSKLAIKFDEKLTIYLLPEDNFFLKRELSIYGDPSFVGFNDGKEKSRLLGKVLFEELAALCDRLLAQGK